MNTNITKVLLIISFLMIMISSGKLTIPNGDILLVSIVQTVMYFPDKGLSFDKSINSIMALITIISLIFIVVRPKSLNLIGIFLQFIWLVYLFKKEDMFDIYYVVTISICLLLNSALLILLFKKEKAYDNTIYIGKSMLIV